MNVTGVVSIDLRDGDEFELHRAVQRAVYAPAGADVEFIVSARQWPPYHGVQYLREHGEHLGRIVIRCGDVDTVRVWVAALRGQEAA
ncbi:hypothetical protein [Nocardioides sp. J54]|uniref:hypothetical protein n=1 Tax=Nocardioides sp. J54 TaxID=935866 RepID=UPI00048B3C4D|nr:hypothetical protein [Nocardioides sp. J54]